MSKILITGSNGFVGQNIKTHLEAKGFEVFGVSRNKGSFQWDELLAGQLSAKVWIHLAAKAHDLKGSADDSVYFKVNTDLAISTFEQFLKDENSEMFVYFSSVKAAADEVKGELMEEDQFEVTGPYGQSKRKAEKYLLAQSLPNNKKLIIFRPCMIHGPGNKGNLNLLFSLVKKGIPYPLGAFENQRSFLYIGNLEYILGRIIADKGFPGGVYNLADDTSLSTNELVRLISKVLNKRSKIWNINSKFVKFLAKTGDALKLPLNTHRLNKLTESYIVSNKKIKKELKIEKLPYDVSNGMVNTLKSFME